MTMNQSIVRVSGRNPSHMVLDCEEQPPERPEVISAIRSISHRIDLCACQLDFKEIGS